MAKVLLIEDNGDVREMMRTALELDGHEVVGASNGREALGVLRRGMRPCVILLDLMMPVMDGWEFRAALEDDPELANTPVIVISAVGGNLLEQIEAAAYVSKPVDIDRLLAIVCEQCH